MALSVTVHGIATVAGPNQNGRWATADIIFSDGSDNIIYEIPGTVEYVIAAISVLNRSDKAVSGVNIAIAKADTPLDSEFIEWKTTIVPRGVLERTQLLLEPGDRIIVRVDPLVIFDSSNDLTPEEWSFNQASTTELLLGFEGVNILKLGAFNNVFFGQSPGAARRDLGPFSNANLKGTYNLTADVLNSNDLLNPLPVTAQVEWRQIFSYQTVAQQTVDSDPPTDPGRWNIGQINLDFTFPDYEYGVPSVRLVVFAPDALVSPTETFGYARNIVLTRIG
jgi:hypothetical protein